MYICALQGEMKSIHEVISGVVLLPKVYALIFIHNPHVPIDNVMRLVVQYVMAAC